MGTTTYTYLSNKTSSAREKVISDKINASTRLFGMPHQLLAHCDPRLGTGSDLGRKYAETFIMESPSICIKPGIARFLPGANSRERESFLNAMLEDLSGRGMDKLRTALLGDDDEKEDVIQYYDHEGKYGSYMKGVNQLCHVMAELLGLGDVRVPWVENDSIPFKKYDWKNYRLSSVYGYSGESDDDDDTGWLERTATKISDFLSEDDQYVQFYVDASASFNETISNSTTTSALETLTQTIEGYSKELSMIVGTVSGTGDWEKLAQDMVSSGDSYVQKFTGDTSGLLGDTIGGTLGTIVNRLSSGAKQVIQGGNFEIPEIYNNSSYDKGYSFSMTLSTPYGSKLAWYINIGVVLCHLLGLALPLQLSANTYKSPFLLKCFSQGWFNCSLGIIDSISIDKGGDQSWSIYGLPNEVKVSISIKDMYSALSLPANVTEFMRNSGMIEFLMVNCGIDITNQKLSNKYKVWATLLSDAITEEVSATVANKVTGLRDKITNRLMLYP